MSENLKSFLKLASQDESLKARAAELTKMEKEELVKTCIALAAERGITLTEADFELVSGANSREISDEELDAVSGGGTGCFVSTHCVCYLGGSGSGVDEYDKSKYVCACVAYGQGGDGSADDFNCFCPAYGNGDSGDRFN